MTLDLGVTVQPISGTWLNEGRVEISSNERVVGITRTEPPRK